MLVFAQLVDAAPHARCLERFWVVGQPYIFTYIHICTHTHTHIYIYIYIISPDQLGVLNDTMAPACSVAADCMCFC